MSWLRLDDQYPEHPKVAVLSDPAFRAHVRCMAYCARHLTDGFIPKTIAAEFAGVALPELVRKPRIGEPLLETCDGGYLVHDYLTYNPTREKVLADRARTAERVNRHRNASSNGVTDSVSDGVSTDAPYPSLDLDPKTSPRTPKGTSPCRSQAVDNSVLGYFEGKVGREATPDELTSMRVLLKTYSPETVCVAIGQAAVQGDVTNFALITSIAKAEAAA